MTSETRMTAPPSQTRSSGYPWRRLLLSALFIALLWLSFWAIAFVALAQFVIRAFDEEASGDLAAFGRRLGRYMHEIAGYVTLNQRREPFPFSRFPQADDPLTETPPEP